jgi:hypothetical protein
MSMTVNRAAIYEAAEKLSNWGRWGPDDELGTLNLVSPQDVIDAAKLIRKGKTFALGLLWTRRSSPACSAAAGTRSTPCWPPGTDAAAGNQDIGEAYLRYADDSINMPCQCSTQWDALAHIFLDDKMWNGYPAHAGGRQGRPQERDRALPRQVRGARRAARRRPLQGRRGMLPDGYAITNADLDAYAEGAGGRDPQGRLRHRPHRPAGALPEVRRMGRLRRRRRAGPRLRDLLLDPRA